MIGWKYEYGGSAEGKAAKVARENEGEGKEEVKKERKWW